MTRYRFATTDVFTRDRFGGNPLAVVLDAEGLSDRQMQQLAAEFNYSETTFVLPPQDESHSACVRIFNRKHEMPFAGHPNVGTAYILATLNPQLGDRLIFEEKAGLVAVEVVRDDSGKAAGALINAPQPLSVGMELSRAAVAECLRLEATDLIIDAHPPTVASVGVEFAVVEIASDALPNAEPNMDAFRQLVRECDALRGRLSIFCYAMDGRERARARMFAPLTGTWEDPATGSAAAALGALRLAIEGGQHRNIQVTQGTEMGRTSHLSVTSWRDGSVTKSAVQGDCVLVFQGDFAL